MLSAPNLVGAKFTCLAAPVLFFPVVSRKVPLRSLRYPSQRSKGYPNAASRHLRGQRYPQVEGKPRERISQGSSHAQDTGHLLGPGSDAELRGLVLALR